MGDPAPSYTEISAALSMAVGTIGPARAKALRRLRQLLAAGAADGELDVAS